MSNGLSRGFESLNRKPQERTREFSKLVEIVDGCDLERLNKWEQGFVDDVLAKWPFTPTEQQCTTLREIKDKLL